MIYGDKQFRDVYIATAANIAARASADLLADGEVQAFNVAGTGLAAAGERFAIFTNKGGVIRSGDVIDPANVITSKTTDYVADVNKVMNVAIPTPVVGQSFEIRLLVRDWGMKSAQDYVTVYGQFIATSTTASDVATGLAAALNQSLAFVTTTKVAATASTSNVVLTGSNEDFKLFQFDGKPVDFEVSLTNPSVVAGTVTTARKDGKGEGYDIKHLEFFSSMVTGDFYADSEISYTKDLLASESLTYDVIEISYYSERLSAPGDKQRKVVTIASLSTLTLLDANAQITAPLQTIGLGLADLA